MALRDDILQEQQSESAEKHYGLKERMEENTSWNERKNMGGWRDILWKMASRGRGSPLRGVLACSGDWRFLSYSIPLTVVDTTTIGR